MLRRVHQLGGEGKTYLVYKGMSRLPLSVSHTLGDLPRKTMAGTGFIP